jgi:formylglycine-generating enzyme required for sulfatase activity
MYMRATYLSVFIACLLSFAANANDIAVSSATLTGQDATADFTLVRFDINWSNSWRTNSGPSNWDAAWIFVKFRIEGGTGCTPGGWQHATLSANNGDHSVTANNGVAPQFAATADGRGVFMYRAGNGAGSIDWDQVLLRWNYGVDGVLDNCNVSVKVFAVEMVYVPQGNFYAGDNSVGSLNGQFEAGNTSAAFLVTGEGSLTLGGSGVGSLGNNNNSGMSTPDDFNDATSQTLPAAFPKGFAAFYSMKYEISQEQYSEFLNVLTPTQQLQRHGASVVNRFINNGGSPPNRNGIKCRTLPVIATSIVGVYASDLDNDNIFNETNDGQNIACNYLSAMDLMAYFDWSGLRIMTELELEKAMRGTLPGIPAEYAWGSTSIYGTSYAPLINPGAGNELPTSPSTTLGNAAYNTTTNVLGGPLRVGLFAIAASSRVEAGASYYGIMEMSGNVWEVPVGVGNVAGRSYTGLHGNGSLSATGFANVDNWPGANGNAAWGVSNAGANAGSTQAAGLGFRAGTWNDNNWLETSDRSYPAWTGVVSREVRQGGRGVRTAP